MPDNHFARLYSRAMRKWVALMPAMVLSACTSTMTPTPEASNATSAPQVVPVPSTVTAAAPESTDSSASSVEREIVDIAWMSGDFSREITEAVTCQDIGVLVTTRGYAEGEDVNVTVGEKNGTKERDVKLYGKVDADGKVRISWPAMGCVDNVPTPLLGGSTEQAPAAKAARPSKKRAKQKAVSGKPSNLSPRKDKTTPFDDPATMIDPPRTTAP